jgi:ferredoxin-NADP reductase
MVAGGIGITPMLAMLRYMADIKDERKIKLIWSNRNREDIVFPEEFIDLEKQLKGLQVIHVLTRDPNFQGEKGRLDKSKLERLLKGSSREAAVFICGPPIMMTETRNFLLELGFPKSSIHMERFSL